MRRRSGRPLRELHAVGNRHGLGRAMALRPSSPSPGGAQHRVVSVRVKSGVEPSSESIPARKPFSQERCPSENGGRRRNDFNPWAEELSGSWRGFPLQRAYEGLSPSVTA